MISLKEISVIFVVVFFFLTGCGPDTSKFNDQLKSKKLLDSGITFNKACDVVYYWSSEGRDGDYEHWVIFSKNKLSVPVRGEVTIDFKLSLNLIRQSINNTGRSKFREIIDPKSCTDYDWNQNKAEYRGFIIEAKNGYFLYLDRFGK